MKLGIRDLGQLRHATNALLSPLDHDDIDQWRLQVNRLGEQLLEADISTCMLPVEGRPHIISEQFGMHVVDAYPEWLRSCDESYGFTERQLRLGVWDRRGNYGPHYERVLAGAYYHDFVVPARAFDVIGITVRVGSSEPVMACLMFHHDHPTRRKFGRRGLQLLGLLLPAFRAGADSVVRLHATRHELGRVVDELGEAILIAAPDGGVLHRSRGLRQVLADEPEADELIAAMRETASGMPFAAAPAARWIRTRKSRYALHATWAPAGLAPSRVVLVSLHAADRIGGAGETLRQRYRLTRKEARVATLLAERRSNREIAEALVISPHTARHHTEQVLRKLGLNSRTGVAQVLADS